MEILFCSLPEMGSVGYSELTFHDSAHLCSLSEKVYKYEDSKGVHTCCLVPPLLAVYECMA